MDAWLDLFLGSECVGCGLPGRVLCPGCVAALPTEGRRVRPDPCPPGLAPAFAAGEYADPLRAMVLAHKEHRALALARPLGHLLGDVVGSLVDQLGEGPGARPGPGSGPGSGEGSGATAVEVLLVPVPSHRAVIRQRGHDPLGRIVRVAAVQARRRGVVVRCAPLLRQRQRLADQAGLDSRNRAANLHDSLQLRPAARRALVREGRPVAAVVCDDVLTTGATAREAQRALEDSGIPVLGIACVAATRKRTGRPLPFSHDSG